jgi:glycine/D-amino acid oxidase-like deaminating enzyme
MANYNYLIAGQGIAGTMLAHFFLKRGKRILVADSFNSSSSSNIAAGLFNPVTGKRLVTTWKADLILPFARQTYQELELLFGTGFYFSRNILRFLSSTEDVTIFLQKKDNPDFQEYVHAFSKTDQQATIEITKAGYVDMAKLVKAFRLKLLHDNILLECSVNHEDLTFENGKVFWKNNCFDKIIFCEGYKASRNPLFSWLPFNLAKGEILIIHSKDFKQNKIWMKDIFVLPLGNDFYKVGSTYQWDNHDEIPTEAGKIELLQKLDNLLDCSYEVVKHLAGVRPTVKDRKPIIGMHPIHNNLGIFNGMGAKGASLAPFFANQFVEALEDGKPLDKEVDIARFL